MYSYYQLMNIVLQEKSEKFALLFEVSDKFVFVKMWWNTEKFPTI